MSSHEEKQKEYLFTDLRHIDCGDLRWLSPDEKTMPLYPDEPAVPLHSGPVNLPRGITLQAQKAHKESPLPPDAPRPERGVCYENGVYRSWSMRTQYPANDREKGCYSKAPPEKVSIIYCESNDGYDWRRKHACDIDVVGFGHDGFTIFKDPIAPESEQYKAVFMAQAPNEQRPELWRQYQRINPRYRDTRMSPEHMACMYGVVSPDGLNWKLIHEPLFAHHSDTDTNVYYDQTLERYVMFTRLYWERRRLVARCESEDFRHWTHLEPLIWADLNPPYSDDIYTNGYTTYPGLPSQHLMFPNVYHRFTQTSDVFLHSSIDALRWNRVPGGPVIERGPAGTFDGQYLGGMTRLVPFGNDKVGLWYTGYPYPHKYPRWDHVFGESRVAPAWWQKGRLCAVKAQEDGEFYTLPIQPAGRTLKLNARAEYAGGIWVEVCGVQGRTMADCAPVIGDGLALPVSWKDSADIGAPENQAVVLHFRLRSAELFGFKWEGMI